MKNVVVFGGSGFLGSHVCDKLMEYGYNVTVFDKNESEFIKGKHNVIIGENCLIFFLGILWLPAPVTKL